MAKKKEELTASSVISDFLGSAAKQGTGSKAYLSGDHAERTWGLTIPYLAFQWFIGGSSVIPMQRYLGVSGEKSSFKSTLLTEISGWLIDSCREYAGETTPNGIHNFMDIERKTSPEMLRALALGRYYPRVDQRLAFYEQLRAEYGSELHTYLDGQLAGNPVDAVVRAAIAGGKSTAESVEELRMDLILLEQAAEQTETLLGHRLMPEEMYTMEDWMDRATEFIGKARKALALPKGQRIPLMLTVDSIMALATKDQRDATVKEGHAEGRQFPIGHAMLTNYFDSMSLVGTPMIFTYVQHMKEKIDAQGHGKQYREKGASAAGFAASIHIRAKKVGTVSAVNHSGRWVDGPTVEGYTIRLETSKSCVGPDKRRLDVDVVWQNVPVEFNLDELHPETGLPIVVYRQVMRFDWDGALGNLLRTMKYEKELSAFDKQRLSDTLHFVVTGKNVKCEELGLLDATMSEFGRAIQANPKVCRRVQDYLGITRFKDFQEADAEAILGDK